MAHARMRDGAQLHYYTLGRGPTVVLLHGFAMPAFLWLPFVAPLAARYRFVLPDLRGFGGSHGLPVNGRCMLTQHADDLADLLKILGEDSVILGGLSMGACTALQYHRLYGMAGVRAYLHMDQSPCVRNGEDWRNGLLGAEQNSRLGDWKDLMEKMEAWRGKPFNSIPRSLRRRMWSTLSVFFGHAMASRSWRSITSLAKHEVLIRRVAPVSNWPIYMDVLRSYLTEDYDWRPTLPKIRVPFTAFVGMRSTMYPPAGQLEIGRLLPHAEILRFEDAGHAIPFEAPARFTWELAKFLRKHRSSAALSSAAARSATRGDRVPAPG